MATAKTETIETTEDAEAKEAPAETSKPKKTEKASKKKLKPKPKKEKKEKKPKAEKEKKEKKPKAEKPKKEKKEKKEKKPKAEKEKKPKAEKEKKPKAEKPKKEKKPKGPQVKRGMTMNKWEKWLCQYFEEMEEGAEVHNAKLTEAIKPYVKEKGGPEDTRRVILNSVRRLVDDGWIERSSRGSYKTTGKTTKLAAERAAIAAKVKEAREKLNWSSQDMADLLGHPSRGRYVTLEQGRRPMHIWEAYTLARALEVSIP